MAKFTKNELQNIIKIVDAIKTKDSNYQLRYTGGALVNMNYLDLVKETPTQLVFKNLSWTNKDEKFIYVDKKTKVATYNSGKNFGTMTVDVDDSICDRLGEGKCAPVGLVSLVSLAEDAAELLKKYSENKSDPLYEKKLAYAKHKYDQMKNMIERKRQEIDNFDRYWQSHKNEMIANILAAEKLLR